MKMRVLDLNSGLGGRIYAFEKAGFEVVAAIDNDVENCEIRGVHNDRKLSLQRLKFVEWQLLY